MHKIRVLSMEKKKEMNAFAVVFVFFLYSLTTLPGLYVNQGLLTMGLAVLVFFPILAKNLFSRVTKANMTAICIELFMLIVLLLEYLVYDNYSKAIQESGIYLLSIGSIGLLVGSFEFDYRYCYKYGQILAYVCFVTSALFLWLTPYKFLMSMRFGYAMLPSVLWFLLVFIEKKSRFDLLLFLAGLFTLVAWGSRGTLLVVLIFLLLYLLKERKKLFAALVIVTIPLLTVLRNYVLELLDAISDLTHARKINKLIIMLDDDEEIDTSSGRDAIYDHCIDLIQLNPFGNGVGFWTKDPVMHGLFPHNVFLHVGTEFGIIGMAVLVIVLIYAMKKMFDFKGSFFYLLVFFFSIMFGRLMVSSMYWARPEFWFFIGLFLCNRMMKREAIVF